MFITEKNTVPNPAMYPFSKFTNSTWSLHPTGYGMYCEEIGHCRLMYHVLFPHPPRALLLHANVPPSLHEIYPSTSFPIHVMIRLQSRVVWLGTVLFCFFRKATGFCRSRIFLEVQFPKISNFSHARASHARQSFHFEKSTVALKIYIFFLNICINLTYCIRQRTIIKKKIRFFFFLPKMAKTVLDLNNTKKFVLSFSFFQNQPTLLQSTHTSHAMLLSVL